MAELSDIDGRRAELMRTLARLYRLHGAPYGLTAQGIKRWLSEQKRGTADPRAQQAPRGQQKGL